MNVLRRIKWILTENARRVLFRQNNKNQILYLVVENSEEQKVTEVKKRIQYYDSTLHIETIDRLSLIKHFDYSLVGFVTWHKSWKKYILTRIKHHQVYNFDFDTNVGEGWEYHRLLANLYAKDNTEAIAKGRNRLKNAWSQLHNNFNKAYIFGTGPSLEKAGKINWNDGLRIVCNTIVKDQSLWNHLQPHFIVAADAIYHFGLSDFAIKFRTDLAKRLTETPATWFVFPAYFYTFCLHQFPEFEERMIPVPEGDSQHIHESLLKSFVLPSVLNVLPSMMLPLACTFSKNIYLWGFDGRAPGDKLFWKNSDKHFYNDDVTQLRKLHPAFFDTHVPKGNEDKYVRKVHGDVLEKLLTEAEQEGFHFHMMHFSHTPVLQKRAAENQVNPSVI